MNVLLVTEPGENGVFRYVDALAHFLVAQGVRVHLAYSDRRSGSQLPELVDFVRRHGGATLNLGTGNRPALADLPAFFSLHSLVRAVRPDVIHSHSSKAGVLARVLKFLGVTARQFYQPHAYAGMRPQPRVSHVIYDGIERLLGRCGITINVSPDEQAYARRNLHLRGDRTVCIANGVDTDVFRPTTPEEKRALRRALGLPLDAKILGSLGRASPQKDPATLYRAFALARARQADLVLFHLGCGELDGTLDRLVEEHALQQHVVRRAYLADPADFYGAIDGFILTSVYEGFSLAALEALSCDLPLILSRAPGNRALLNLPLTHVYSAPVGDVPQFAREIVRWATADIAPGGRTQCNHRQIAITRFDCQRSFRTILDLYRGPGVAKP